MNTRRNFIAIFEHLGGRSVLAAQALSFVAEEHNAEECAQDIVDFLNDETGHGTWVLRTYSAVGEWLP
jgi:hypothetical protein